MTHGSWCSLGLQYLPNKVILGVDPPLAWAQRSSQFSCIPVFLGTVLLCLGLSVRKTPAWWLPQQSSVKDSHTGELCSKSVSVLRAAAPTVELLTQSVLGFTLLTLFFKVPGTVAPWEVGTRARDSEFFLGL